MSVSVGVDFSLGFGPQPGDLIRSRVAEATCLSACTPALSIQLEKTEIDCFGGTGSIAVLPEGGSGIYFYQWSNGDTSNVTDNLPAGEYFVTITDDEGSEIIISESLVQPDELQLSSTVIDQTYPGSSDGVIEIAVSGGIEPYNLVWSNGFGSESAVGLEEGVYQVTVTDANSCELVDTISVRTTFCENMQTSFPMYDGIENSIVFGTQDIDDDFDWMINTENTPTKETGPENAYEGSFYLYLEATDQFYGTSILTSKCFTLSDMKDPVFGFAYHLFGDQMGTLNVDLTEDFGETWTNLWSRSGNQGNDWLNAAIDLSSYSNSIVQIRFVGTIGGDKSDMAIDGIHVADKEDVVSANSYVPQMEESLLSIYPNPTSGIITVGLGNEITTNGNIVITNITGNTVKRQDIKVKRGENAFTFDLSVFQEGIYFLTLERKDQLPLTGKFVIIR